MKTVKVFPVTKDYIWGGQRLKDYGVDKANEGKVAEAWMLSFLSGNESILADGTPISKAATRADYGSACNKFKDFPVLIKLIDAADDLSVQVHPDDNYAKIHENSFGKTEMWYIVDCLEGAGLYMGFKRIVTKDELKAAVKDGTVTDLLNFVKVKKGDYFFIPPGTVHAIGKGCLICEVQQSSNVTYRLFDFNRTDAMGNKRELHIEKSLDVANLDVVAQPRTKDFLSKCEYFTVRHTTAPAKTGHTNSFTAIVVINGNGTVDGQKAKKGDCFFIPAGQTAKIEGSIELIETFVE